MININNLENEGFSLPIKIGRVYQFGSSKEEKYFVIIGCSDDKPSLKVSKPKITWLWFCYTPDETYHSHSGGILIGTKDNIYLSSSRRMTLRYRKGRNYQEEKIVEEAEDPNLFHYLSSQLNLSRLYDVVISYRSGQDPLANNTCMTMLMNEEQLQTVIKVIEAIDPKPKDINKENILKTLKYLAGNKEFLDVIEAYASKYIVDIFLDYEHLRQLIAQDRFCNFLLVSFVNVQNLKN